MVKGVFDKVLETEEPKTFLKLKKKKKQRKRRIKGHKFNWKTRSLSERSHSEYSSVFLPQYAQIPMDFCLSPSRRGLQGKSKFQLVLVTQHPVGTSALWVQPSSGLGSERAEAPAANIGMGPQAHTTSSSTSSGHWQPCHPLVTLPPVTRGSQRRLRKRSGEEEPRKYTLVNNIVTLFLLLACYNLGNLGFR